MQDLRERNIGPYALFSGPLVSVGMACNVFKHCDGSSLLIVVALGIATVLAFLRMPHTHTHAHTYRSG